MNCLKKADLKVKITFCDADYDNRSEQTLESSFDREIYENNGFYKAFQFSIVCVDCFKVWLQDGRSLKKESFPASKFLRLGLKLFLF